nr:CRISPR-associated helicase Cas3' [Pyrobaculum sp.]
MAGSLKRAIREMVEAWCAKRGEPCRINDEVLERQAEVAEKIRDAEGLVVLRAPTGYGKTEAWSAPFFAQWRAREWFAPRMYIVEPVHALLRQMRERMEVYAGRFGAGITVGEDHGEAPSDVYLYTAVVTLTTVDALVYGYLAQRVVKWRKQGVEMGYYTTPAGLLVSSYIVLDEAHLMQDEFYLGPRILGEIVCDLVEAGAKVVMSTATLPAVYLKYFRCFEEGNLIDLEGPDRSLKIDLRNGVLTSEELNKEIDCNKRNIVIVNTVRKAREIYRDLRCERKAVVHSLMRKKDREHALKSVREGGVLIGTQTLEVGLDFTLDVLYTELSPVDSLVQRLGRVGRRGPGRAVIYRAERPTPYLKGLVEKTEEVIGGDPSQLNKWGFVKEAVDIVYSEEAVEDIAERSEAIYAEALAYLSELSLFSYPPRREVLLRPSHYAIVYIIDGKPREKIEKTELLDGMVKMSYKRYEKSRLKYLVERVDIYIMEGVDKDGKYLLRRADKRRGGDELVIFLEDLKRLGLYDEAGIVVEELGAGDEDEQEARKEKTRKSRRKK